MHRKNEAAAHHRVIEQHGAGAAHPLLAADMRSGQPEVVAQKIDQRLARFDPLANLLAIDAQFDLKRTFVHREPGTGKIAPQ